MSMQRITILGATGSIGKSTLDVISRHPTRYQVYALTAHINVSGLADLCEKFSPEVAVVGTPESAERLSSLLRAKSLSTRVECGEKALCEVASADRCDVVMAAIVGAAGLAPSLAAAHAGKKILLANKEALVMAGRLFIDAVHASGAELLPIDSEHNAIFQCMPSNFLRGLSAVGIAKVLLTASGGPFLNRAISTLDDVTPEEAVAHPKWVMGRKISVDSATMMNKGLEVIEAHWLFAAPAEQIEVVIHPQSVIHSMVSYVDGSVLAQLGNPDMRTPIAHALAFPERIESGVAQLDLAQIAKLEFHKPDLNRFPCLRLAFEALEMGGNAPAILNAANEVAVEAFLERKIGFRMIDLTIENVMRATVPEEVNSIDTLLEYDREARVRAHAFIAS